MSKHDVRDMLGLGDEEPRTAVKKRSRKEVEGTPGSGSTDLKKGHVVGKLGKKNPLRREVKALQSVMLGVEAEAEEEAAPVVPVFTGLRKKAKPTKLVRKWEQVSYMNKEGPGSFALTHCRPVNDPNRDRNTFLRLDKKAEIFTYTDAQYAAHFGSNDWSREETDRLMELVLQFDGRLVLVFDRWEDVPGKRRTLEDLKERFYFIQGVLHPASSFRYEAEAAKRRTRHFEILYNRTGHEVWEEFEIKKRYAPIADELRKAQGASARSRSLSSAMERGVKDYITARDQADAEPATAGNSSWRNASDARDEFSADEDDEVGEDWSSRKERKSSKKKPHVQKQKKGETSHASLQAMQAAVDEELALLKVPGKPSKHIKTQNLHAELRNSIMVMLDMRKLLLQKQYEIELLKASKQFLLEGENQ